MRRTRGFFNDFVKAQNAHDLKHIRSMLWGFAANALVRPGRCELGPGCSVYVVCLFGFIIWIGLAISWIFFHGVKPPLA